ncbi:MAG TPA: glutathione S-transferase family protein [Solirubrobacterales bacterium]|nr:glutathione S-transferase family protein [Solirubrobacterales bacterium]
MIVYGSEYSYFTGKFEAYLRYKEIPYERRPLGFYNYLWRIPRKVGVAQLPTVELPGGRWMTDTTPMIGWLEQQHPTPPVLVPDPLQRFFGLLIEDFADEWLWRSAMHYRWDYAPDRALMRRQLASELLRVPLPLAIRARWIGLRQRRIFVTGDGVDRRTRPHVDAAYTRALDRLEPVLAERPFLFGERPTIADFGLMGPMFRHFAIDPTPARIMRDRAPAVYEWVARVWGARASRLGGGELLDGLPQDLGPLLRESGETHLEMLAANAAAHGRGESRYDLRVQGVTYERIPTSSYRVWALEQLRHHFRRLPIAERERAEELLRSHGCWVALWRVEQLDSGHDPDRRAPFGKGSRMVRDGGLLMRR